MKAKIERPVYTAQDRYEIARNILEYIQGGRVHSWALKIHFKAKEEGVEEIRQMDEADRAWLEVVAKDVLGEIYHDEETWISTRPAY